MPAQRHEYAAHVIDPDAILKGNPFRTATFRKVLRELHPGVFEVRAATILKRLREKRPDLADERVRKTRAEQPDADVALFAEWALAVEGLIVSRVEAYLEAIGPRAAAARASKRGDETGHDLLVVAPHPLAGQLVELLRGFGGVDRQQVVDPHLYRIRSGEGSLLFIQCEATGKLVPVHNTRVRPIGGAWGDLARKK